MTRYAAIDIGTNSTKMTVAEAGDNGELAVLVERSEITRLGKGVDAAKSLQEAAMDRTLAVVRQFAEEARAQGVEKIVAAGTSALRDAANGSAFIDTIKTETGVSVEIIAGEREAQLAYRAATSDESIPKQTFARLLVFDIGGGSSELTLGHAGNLIYHMSLDIGAVRITERFLTDDPPTHEEVNAAVECIDQLLPEMPTGQAPLQLIGIGGTAVNLAAVKFAESGIEGDVHGKSVTTGDVAAALSRFLAVRLADRREISGLEPARADVIIGGALIVSRLLRHVQQAEFIVSARGLRFGLLAEAAGL